MAKLTKLEALQKAYEMWSWLAERPAATKKDFFGEVDSSQEKFEDYCALCEYTYESIKAGSCSSCPVDWGKYNTCHDLFQKWNKYGKVVSLFSIEELKFRYTAAKKIRDLIKKSLDKELDNVEKFHHIENDRIEMDIIRKGNKVKVKIYKQDDRFRSKDIGESIIIYETREKFYIKSCAVPEVRHNTLWLLGHNTYETDSAWYAFPSVAEADNWISRCKEAIEDWARNWDGFKEVQSDRKKAVPSSKTPLLEFKQLCWFWDDDVNGCVCNFFGLGDEKRDVYVDIKGNMWHHCELYQGAWPKWAIEDYRKIKPLKYPEHQKLYERIRQVDEEAAEKFRHYIVEWELWRVGQISEPPIKDIDVTDILQVCFVWGESREGYNYWSEVCAKLERRNDQ